MWPDKCWNMGLLSNPIWGGDVKFLSKTGLLGPWQGLEKRLRGTCIGLKLNLCLGLS